MNLLIDIGNSRLKWGLLQNGAIFSQMALDHQQNDWQTLLLKSWQQLEKPQKIAICSVASPEKAEQIIDLANQLWKKVKIIIPTSMANGFGVQNGYLYPQKLGVDRWLCLIATRHFYKKAAWIVDCGSAITVDFINEHGLHNGGLIAPGLKLMKKALSQNTAALNYSWQNYPLGLANFTEGAIFTGTLYAAVGLIEQAVVTQATKAMIVLTGGDAELISPHLSHHSIIVDPDLVLRGLAIFIQQ